MKKSLIICDDHVMFSDMIADFLHGLGDGGEDDGVSYEVIHTQDTTEGLSAKVDELKPDLLLSDLMLPGPPVFDLMPSILSKHPDLRILVMSGMFNEANTSRLYKAGVHGIVSKLGNAGDILKAVKALLAGQIHYPQDLLDRIKENPEGVGPKITKREVEIMVLISRGMSEKQIAAELGIAENTVNNHKGNIFSKLGVSNQVSMVVEAIRRGLIPNPAVATPES